MSGVIPKTSNANQCDALAFKYNKSNFSYHITQVFLTNCKLCLLVSVMVAKAANVVGGDVMNHTQHVLSVSVINLKRGKY